MSCTIFFSLQNSSLLMVAVTDGNLVINQTNIYLGIEKIDKGK